MGMTEQRLRKILEDELEYEIHKDETPRHSVYIDAFYLDQKEITVAQYAQFLKALQGLKNSKLYDHPDQEATKSHIPKKWIAQLEEPEMPVVGVDWFDAYAYSKWAGKRLPTEAEWEKSARGTQEFLYPWGNDPPTPKLANYFLNIGKFVKGGSYPKGNSIYQVSDSAGNVWEWVYDSYSPTYYRCSEPKNPQGPAFGTQRCFRGGSFQTGPEDLRSTYRSYNRPDYRVDDLGFRCAKDL